MLEDMTDFEISESMLAFPEADFRFSTLNSYVSEISESVLFIYNQKCTRLKAKINAEDNIEIKGELECDLDYLEQDGIEIISHTIWGGVLISIFSTFENSISDILDYCCCKLDKPKFKRIKGKSFVESVHEYSVKHLAFGLFTSALERTLIIDFSQLRNSYVHNGCKIDTLPKRLRAAILENKYGEYTFKRRNLACK